MGRWMDGWMRDECGIWDERGTEDDSACEIRIMKPNHDAGWGKEGMRGGRGETDAVCGESRQQQMSDGSPMSSVRGAERVWVRELVVSGTSK